MKHLLFLSLIFVLSFPLMAQSGKIEKTTPAYSTGLIKPKVELFPTTATKYLYVDVGADSANVLGFELYNIIGSKVPVFAEKMEGGIYRFDVENLYEGQYMLIIKDPKKAYPRTYKFTKRKEEEE